MCHHYTDYAAMVRTTIIAVVLGCTARCGAVLYLAAVRCGAVMCRAARWVVAHKDSNPQIIANIMWACATLGHLPTRLLRELDTKQVPPAPRFY